MDDTNRSRWWRRAVGYEVYLRSFADGNGDGIGDLIGLRRRLGHLSDLGVDLLWVTPFYPSPMADYGYDVADYCDVDPVFGTLADVDALLEEAHSRGIRVIVDLVPNHTSDQHPWFRSARRSRDDPHRDWYVWADPGPGGGPPNNWVSYFGGPAWTLDEVTGQYYLHLFLPAQPDLNWRSPGVLDAFDGILAFWLDRGVDGFRIDVAQALVKDADLRSNPQVGPWDPAAPRLEQWAAFDHRYDIAQPGVADVFRRWRTIADRHDAFLLGETYVFDTGELKVLLPGDGLHAGFWFMTMRMAWDPAGIRHVLSAPAVGASIAWASGSHDEQRPVTRFGGGVTGRARALAVNTLLFGLPGVPFLYQGDELGLGDGELQPEDKHDPVGATVGASRDGSRTPIPWSPGPYLGFSTVEPWLPVDGRDHTDTVEVQRADGDSPLAKHRQLVSTRRGTEAFADAPIEWVDGHRGPVVAFRRGSVVVAANLTDDVVTWSPPVSGRVLFGTHRPAGDAVGATLTLRPAEALMVDQGSADA